MSNGITVEKVVKKSTRGIYSTGKRKEAAARVWVKNGSGKIEINGRTVDCYFKTKTLHSVMMKPFVVTDSVNKYDVYCTVSGGGVGGQAGAIAHGISRALALESMDLRAVLKKAKMLTRDSRRVERKKPGQPKARKAFQFCKR